MWYLTWILGTFLACAFGIITALAIEHLEDIKLNKENIRDSNNKTNEKKK